MVLFGDLEGYVHAVNRSDGVRVWRVDKDSDVWGELSTDGSRVFSAHEDGKVYALNLSDGSEAWSFEAGDSIYGGTTTANGRVYFTSHDAFVYALDAESGEQVYAAEMARGSNVTPTLAEDLLLVGAWDDRVYAFDAETGRLEWNIWAGDSVVEEVAADEESAYFGSNDGYVYSVSLADGSLNWRQEIGETLRSAPAVANDIVYIGADNSLHALDAISGAPVYTFETGDEANSPVVASGNLVYFGSNDESVYALAAGFPDGYARAPLEPPPAVDFEPLSPEDLKERLDAAFSSQKKVLGNVAIFESEGKRVEFVDRSDLVIEIFENGYYLLTGRAVQEDGWEARYLTREDYDALADERGSPWLKHSRGWCCIRSGLSLALIMLGDNKLDEAVAVTAHEAGHALQRQIAPAQSKAANESWEGAMREAQAYAFEVALVRKIGEYLDIETSSLPTDWHWTSDLRKYYEEVWEDPAEKHGRGRLLIWFAVLYDPELADLRDELERDGSLSADSAYSIFQRFVGLLPSEVVPYIESITPPNMSDALNYVVGTINKRTGYHLDYPDLVLNVLDLVTTP